MTAPASVDHVIFARHFGANIERLRIAQRMSASELARRVGTSRGTMHRWREGLVTPSAFWLPSLAKALGVSVDDLLQ